MYSPDFVGEVTPFHAEPVHCSMSPWLPPLAKNCTPTAHASVGETSATPRNTLLTPGFCVAVSVQDLPFQWSPSVACGPEVPCAMPTAQTSDVEDPETEPRELYVEGSGLGAIFQPHLADAVAGRETSAATARSASDRERIGR